MIENWSYCSLSLTSPLILYSKFVVVQVTYGLKFKDLFKAGDCSQKSAKMMNSEDFKVAWNRYVGRLITQ